MAVKSVFSHWGSAIALCLFSRGGHLTYLSVILSPRRSCDQCVACCCSPETVTSAAAAQSDLMWFLQPPQHMSDDWTDESNCRSAAQHTRLESALKSRRSRERCPLILVLKQFPEAVLITNQQMRATEWVRQLNSRIKWSQWVTLVYVVPQFRLEAPSVAFRDI